MKNVGSELPCAISTIINPAVMERHSTDQPLTFNGLVECKREKMWEKTGNNFHGTIGKE